MKKKKQDISLRELFRQKLGDAEITPDSSLGARIMKAQDRKEFMRFNPGRFNIFYLGAIITVLATALVILTHTLDKTENVVPLSPSGEISVPANKTGGSTFDVPAGVKITETLSTKSPDLTGTKPAVRPKVVRLRIPEQNINLAKGNTILTADLNNSDPKSNLVSGYVSDNKQLKTGLKSSEILFETSATEGCAPLTINFHNIVSSSDSCKWSFGDGGSSNERNPKWIFDVEGDYKVVLNVFHADTLKATSFAVISVYPKPQSQFEISPENAVLPKDEIHFYNYSTNAVHYKWDFGDGISSELFEPTHRYIKFGNYNVRLVAISDYGCSDSMTVFNAYSGSEYFINFPNAFIPNSEGPTGGYYSATSDEAALVFHPVSSGVSDYQLKIFSRLGILIFESNDINIGWDGYFKGQLSESGVYIWKVRGSFRNGEPFVKTGDVTLLKF